jgi:hypothetical protein
MLGSRLGVGAPFLVQLEDERVGLLFRPQVGLVQPVEYVVFDRDLTVVNGPISVSPDYRRDPVVDQQPRAVRVGSTVFFLDSIETGGARRNAADCMMLRLVEEDGSDAREAPWQPPCVRDDTVVANWTEIGRYNEYVVLLWGERPYVDTLEITSTTEWWADVKLALITREGRLASEPISVVEPSSTVLDPVPRTPDSGPYRQDYHLSLSAPGDTAPIVAWGDRRADAPGVYAREVTCRALTAGGT